MKHGILYKFSYSASFIILMFLIYAPSVSIAGEERIKNGQTQNHKLFADSYMTASGKVVEKETGTAIDGVKLVLISWTEGQVAKTVSDINGDFILKKIPVGSYSLFAKLDKKNFLKSRKSLPVVIEEGKSATGLIVELELGGAIKGRAITSDNIPIKSATIDATSGRPVFSDRDGFFVLRGVTPGNVKVSVIPDHISPKSIEVSCVKSKVTDVGNIVFNLTLENTIRGIIVDPSGEPVSFAIIKSVSKGYPVATSMSREDGKFVATGLEGKKYDLIVVSEKFQQKIIRDVEVPTDYITIKLSP